MNRDDKTLLSVAKSLGINPDWLYNLIKFESNWDPQSKAGYPYNKAKVDKGLEAPRFARGLIQFIDSTAESLGYKSADDLVKRNPSIDSQLLFPVLQYLNQYKPFPTEQSLYLSVFYPVARTWPMEKEFPDSVLKSNPGIKTPGDYVRKVSGKGETGSSVLVMVLTGVALLWYYLKGKQI